MFFYVAYNTNTFGPYSFLFVRYWQLHACIFIGPYKITIVRIYEENILQILFQI